MVKTVEKVELPEDDYKVYKGTCKKLGRSLRKQTTLLIQNFIKSRHSELDDPMVAQSYFRDKVVLILKEYGRVYHEERLKKLNLASECRHEWSSLTVRINKDVYCNNCDKVIGRV